MSFHIDGTEGTGRTEVFASTATDAAFCVDGWELERIGVLGVRRYHGDGTCGTMARTVTAFHLVGLYHTVALDPYGVSYLDGRFVGYGDGFDGSRGADFRSYEEKGCISVIRPVEGRNTSLGHTDTHSWQAVQCCAK